MRFDLASVIKEADEEQKRRYVQEFAFETWIHDPDRGDSLAIAVNLGHTNSKVFDSVWRKGCGCGQSRFTAMIDENGRCRVCEMLVEPYDLMIAFCRRKDKLWNVSLYSTKTDVDCGAIAKSFGGGGHKGAAGFQCAELPFEY